MPSSVVEAEKVGGGTPTGEYEGSQQVEIFEQPSGWKGFYSRPTAQVALLGFVCFMCPGMYNALSGLGGGGQVNPTAQANASSALYATFAFFGFFSGTISNVLGARITLMLGTLGYPLYISSFLVVNIHPNATGYVIASGAVLGVCAAMLWTAQGSLMMAYPTEAQKGLYIGIFWAVFSLGGVAGSAVAFAGGFHSTANSVSNGTYIGFLVLTITGFFLPLLMTNPELMTRTDGTKVVLARHPSWKAEFLNLFVALRTDPWIVLLFPMFFASNYFYTWQFNDYNGTIFTILFIGHCVLDKKRLRRRTRAFLGWVIVFPLVFVVNIWSYFYQKTYTRASEANNPNKIDIYNSSFPAHIWLMIFCGFLDSMWQTYAYWLMGAMSNDIAKLAVFTGFYKCLQSCGAAGVWRADGVGLPYMNIFISTWGLSAAGMLFALPIVYFRVKDHTELEDETLIHVPGTVQVTAGPSSVASTEPEA